MKGSSMLLPSKHVRLSESVYGLGAYVLAGLTSPKTIDEIVAYVRGLHTSGLYPAKHSLENIVLALSFLYALGAVEIDRQGRIGYAAH